MRAGIVSDKSGRGKRTNAEIQTNRIIRTFVQMKSGMGRNGSTLVGCEVVKEIGFQMRMQKAVQTVVDSRMSVQNEKITVQRMADSAATNSSLVRTTIGLAVRAENVIGIAGTTLPVAMRAGVSGIKVLPSTLLGEGLATTHGLAAILIAGSNVFMALTSTGFRTVTSEAAETARILFKSRLKGVAPTVAAEPRASCSIRAGFGRSKITQPFKQVSYVGITVLPVSLALLPPIRFISHVYVVFGLVSLAALRRVFGGQRILRCSSERCQGAGLPKI